MLDCDSSMPVDRNIHGQATCSFDGASFFEGVILERTSRGYYVKVAWDQGMVVPDTAIYEIIQDFWCNDVCGASKLLTTSMCLD